MFRPGLERQLSKILPARARSDGSQAALSPGYPLRGFFSDRKLSFPQNRGQRHIK